MTHKFPVQNAAERVTDLCVQMFSIPAVSIGSDGRTALAAWFSQHVGGGDQLMVDRIKEATRVEPHQHERLPPSPRGAAGRLANLMLDDVERRRDAGIAHDLLLPDLDAVRVMVVHHGLRSLTEELNRLYTACEPVPEPVFTSWNREYRPSMGQHWEMVCSYETHAEAHRGLIKARAECPGHHRVIGVVA